VGCDHVIPSQPCVHGCVCASSSSLVLMLCVVQHQTASSVGCHPWMTLCLRVLCLSLCVCPFLPSCHAADLALGTIHGAFSFVVILVQRLCSEYFRVTVRCKAAVPSFGPIGPGCIDFFSPGLEAECPGKPGSVLPGAVDGNPAPLAGFGVALVPADCVGDVVRIVAINADVACQAMHNGQVRCAFISSSLPPHPTTPPPPPTRCLSPLLCTPGQRCVFNLATLPRCPLDFLRWRVRATRETASPRSHG
jgi:hypothetical protein